MKTFNVIFMHDPDVYEKPIWVEKVQAESAFDAIETVKKSAATGEAFLSMIGGISAKEVKNP